jgi:DNA replication factor GINS
MPEEPITFEFIRKIQRDEHREERLSQIPSDFYEKARAYLEQKKKLAERQKDRNTNIEVRNIEGLLEDIYNRRETKLLNYAILTIRTGLPPQNLIDEEKPLFEALVDTLSKQRERVLNMIFKKSKEKVEFNTVKFLEDVEEFIGIDLKKYGPFKEGDVSKIPKDNAELLEKMKKAVKEE